MSVEVEGFRFYGYEADIVNDLVKRVAELEAENEALRKENNSYEKREHAYIEQIEGHYKPELKVLQENNDDERLPEFMPAERRNREGWQQTLPNGQCVSKSHLVQWQLTAGTLNNERKQ